MLPLTKPLDPRPDHAKADPLCPDPVGGLPAAALATAAQTPTAGPSAGANARSLSGSCALSHPRTIPGANASAAQTTTARAAEATTTGTAETVTAIPQAGAAETDPATTGAAEAPAASPQARSSQARASQAGTPESATGPTPQVTRSNLTMRVPRSLSYSSMSLWYKDQDEFYIRYLADHAAPRLPQEQPAAVGSAFDAYTKSMLAHALFGNAASAQFEFAAIFESQVEPQNRDFALTAGKRVFKAYKLCGAYDDLLKQLQQSVEPPRFEFKVDGLILGVPFTGKPDCRFVLDLGQGRIPCIYDWKVRGYCSKYGASPSKGYSTCLDGFVGKASRSQGKEHAMYKAMDFRGLTINSGYMEFCNDEYADQLSLYGWLLGEKVGDENTVLGIEELCAKFMGEGNPPTLRYARHRGRVKADYQQKLAEKVATCWQAITSGHVFSTLSREDSDARCAVLEEMSVGLASNGTALDDWFNDVTRPKFFH